MRLRMIAEAFGRGYHGPKVEGGLDPYFLFEINHHRGDPRCWIMEKCTGFLDIQIEVHFHCK
jgi:hypothetical protein